VIWMGTRGFAWILPAPSRGLCVVACLLLACSALPIEYTHQKLFDHVLGDPYGYLNDNGDYLIFTYDSDYHSIILLNGEELPQNPYGLKVARPWGLDNEGGWLVSGAYTEPYVRYRALWNNEILDEGWSPYPWDTINGRLCKDGTAYWTNGGQEYAAVMRNGVEFSTQWTDGVYDNLKRVTPGGKVLWRGRGIGGTEPELWFDGVPIMRGYETGEWEFTWESYAVNDAGLFAWSAVHPSQPYIRHLFVGESDLTEAVAGSEGYFGDTVLVNSPGRVLWEGNVGYFLNQRIFLDDQMLFVDLARPEDTALALRLSDRGDVLWKLARPVGQGDSLYINDFDLVADVYGGETLQALRGHALNERGQVLWSVGHGVSYDLWLSTPIPEPSPLLLGLPLLLFLHRHRRQRGT
jgi:hypothetical protein